MFLGGRAGWDIASGTCPGQVVRGALPGPCQTAQRAEVYAVAVALIMLCGPLTVLTDSRYVHDKLRNKDMTNF